MCEFCYKAWFGMVNSVFMWVESPNIYCLDDEDMAHWIQYIKKAKKCYF